MLSIFAAITNIRTRDPAIPVWVGLLVCLERRPSCVGLVAFRLPACRIRWAWRSWLPSPIAAEREGIQIRPGRRGLGGLDPLRLRRRCIRASVAAIVIGGVGMLAVLPRRDGTQPTLRWLTWTAIRVIAVGAAAMTAVVRAERDASRFLGALRWLWLQPSLLRRCSISRSASVAPAIRGTGSLLETIPSVGSAAPGERSPAGSDGRCPRLLVHNDLALERRPLRDSRSRRPTAAHAVPAAARDDRGAWLGECAPGKGEPVICDCSRCDT